MILTKFNGVTFTALSYITGVDTLWGQWQVIHGIERRQGTTALHTGGLITERAIPVEFSYSGVLTYEQAFLALMAILDPVNLEPRTLTAQLNDGTEVSCQAVVQVTGTQDDDRNVNWIGVTFITTDPFWTKTTATSVGPTTINAASPTMAINNTGATTVYPEIVRSPPTSTFTATQSTQKVVTISNTSLMPLERETMVVQGLSTTGITAVTVLKDGTYYPATALLGHTGFKDYYAFPASIDAGESEDYRIIGKTNTIGNLDNYGNFDGNYTALDLSWADFTATGSSATTLTVSGAGWTTDQWRGACMFVWSGTGTSQARMIQGNTGTVLTMARAFTTTPATTCKFYIIPSGYYLDGGKASSATTSTITDSSQSWDAGTLAGGSMTIYAGTGNGSTAYTITDNTATQITISGTFGVTPDTTSVFNLTRPFYHRYHVDQVKPPSGLRHWGGWQANKRYTRPSKILWGEDVLNGWEPFLLMDNGDDFNQSRICPVNVGGGDIDYFPILDADRRKGQDRLLSEEGQADGVAIYHPWGYMGARFDYQQKNPNRASGATVGVCQFVFAGREAGGDEFEYYVQDPTLRTSLTSVSEQFVSLINYGNPEQLYMGQIPYDEVAVDSTASDYDTATVRWGSTLRLWVDMAGKIEPSVLNPETVIPIEDEIRVGKYALQIGKRDGQRLWIRTTNEELHLDCANARAWILKTLTGVVVDVTYAVHPLIYEDRDGDGVEESYLADRWLPIAPGSNTLTASGAPWATNGAFQLTANFSIKVYG